MNRVPMGCCERISLMWLIGSQIAAGVMLIFVWKRDKPVHEDGQTALLVFMVLPFVTSLCIFLYAILRFYFFAVIAFLINTAEMIFLFVAFHLVIGLAAERVGRVFADNLFHDQIAANSLAQYYAKTDYTVNDDYNKIQDDYMTPLILTSSCVMTVVSCFFTLIDHVVAHRPFQRKSKPSSSPPLI